MTNIDTITLLKYQEGSLDDKTRARVDQYLAVHPEALQEMMDLDRIEIAMEKGQSMPVPGTASIQINIIQGLIESFHCNGARASLIPVIATRGDSRPFKHEVNKKKLKIDLQHINSTLEVLAVRGNSYWVVVHSPLLKGHIVKLKRKGDDYPLYTKKASSSTLTIKGLSDGKYEVLFLDDCIDIQIQEQE